MVGVLPSDLLSLVTDAQEGPCAGMAERWGDT